MPEFFNNLWGLGTSKNTVVVPARQTSKAGGFDSLESIPGLPKSLKIPSQMKNFYFVTFAQVIGHGSMKL